MNNNDNNNKIKQKQIGFSKVRIQSTVWANSINKSNGTGVAVYNLANKRPGFFQEIIWLSQKNISRSNTLEVYQKSSIASLKCC